MGFCYVLNWIYDHETLVVGMLGVGAASVSVYLLNKQIRYQATKDQIDRDAKRAAVRSFGPPLIATLKEYGLQCFDHILKLYNEASPYSAFTVDEESRISALSEVEKLPLLERQTLENLKEWIELEESENQKKLIILLENYQVLHSRFSKAIDKSVYRSTLKTALLSSAVFTLVVEECWSFARQIRTSDSSSGSLDDRITNLLYESSYYESSYHFSYDPAEQDDLKNRIKKEYNFYMKNHQQSP